MTARPGPNHLVMLNLIIIKRPSGIYQAEYLVYTWVELANPTQEVPYAIVQRNRFAFKQPDGCNYG
jgi:hypothetical protein